MLERPLLIPLASLIAGLCTADFLGSTFPSWSVAALLATTLITCFLPGRFSYLLSITMLFFVQGGAALKPFLTPDAGLGSFVTEQPVRIQGVVDQRPEGIANGGARVYLQVERVTFPQASSGAVGSSPNPKGSWEDHGGRVKEATGRLLVQVDQGRPRLGTGDRVLLESRIRKPRSLGIPGESDYPRRLAYQGVFATAFVRSSEDLVLVRAGDGWRRQVDRLAASLAGFISRTVPGTEGAVLKALLLGDAGDIPREVSNAYSLSGVNHILSISGFHVSIIFLCLYQGLFLLVRRCELLALHLNLRGTLLVACLPVVIFYLFLSGAAPATQRSVLMIAGVVAALHLKREVDPVNSLMLAASAILCWAPQTIFDLSFQLSFLAIWGLIVLTPPLAAPCATLPAPLRWSLLLMIASAAAILATLVPVAYYFHRVSFIGLLANLAIVPLLGYGAVVAGFAALGLSLLVPAPAELLLRLAAWLVGLSDQVILYFARAPAITGYAPVMLDFLLACLLLCAVTFLRPRLWRTLVSLALLLILCVRAVPAGNGGDGQLRVDFLSVGQGDAALVRLPDGKRMLVDGGGRAGGSEERVGERLLLPALWRLGVPRIDYLVLTHEHPDHLQGILYLAQHFEIGELWRSGAPSYSREYLELNWLAAARGIPVRTVNGATPPFTAGAAVVEPLWPLPGIPSAPVDANERSLVFRLGHGQSSVLFTGDLGAQSEQTLLARGIPLRSSVLKVGHHGSRYASSDPFLSAVSPRAAVISAGYGNPFHLPAPSTLQRLQRHGIPVYRTDLDGTVEAICGADGTVVLSTPWGHFN
ncbi:MAG TPA: DNA internalization-related competence protein ComEC/Rec2 [Geomonas sp.]|nr:DNA internalization-related competence protein ComEC/Rec2 [Geomonas sp.]